MLLLASFLLSADAYTTNAAVNLRDCGDSDNYCKPSTYCANNCCCPVIKTLPQGSSVSILCKVTGQSINGDATWLYVKAGTTYGWVADYYVSCGGVCPGSTC
jgi:hypothetical protein